jgi:hypothetical protein
MAGHDAGAAAPITPPEPSLEARLATLEHLLASQDARIAQQELQIAQQDARMALQDAELAALRASQVMDATTPALLSADAPAAPATTTRRGRTGTGPRASRRALLQLGGAAAAAGVAATAALVAGEGGKIAHAADDGSLLIGNANLGTAQTSLAITGSSSADPFFLVDASSATVIGAAAIKGISNAVDGTGVSGSGGITGVSGISSNGTGVYGQGNMAPGVFGQSNTAAGVYGSSSSGIGVLGLSDSGVGGHFYGARGALNLGQYGTPGAPTANQHYKGDIYLDLFATVWVCIGDGVPGTWVRVATVPNGAVGGATTYLSTPVRLLDARTSPGTALVTRGPLAGNETYAFTVAGLGGSGIPSAAQGLIANVTVLGPSGIGNLSLFPAPGPGPSVASMTFGSPGLFLANGVNVAIGTGGQIMIQNQSSGTTPLVLDAVAFVS